jgi:uncharacterized protein YprB with RNaseH-like and TPR domain
MSSWSSKLERVAFANNPRAIESAKSLETPQFASDVGHTGESRIGKSAEERIASLRVRIADILTRSNRPAASRPEPTPLDIASVESVFAREDTSAGRVFVRTKVLPSAHRVGRVPLYPATEASAPMLALLALDPALSSIDPKRALYLDIETTGLSGGAGTVAFFIGLASFDERGALVLEQFLLADLSEERAMLERLGERMEAVSMLVSYNGKSFDLPVLQTRRVLARLPPLPTLPHLDLVHVARRLHRHRLDQLSLARVESEVLGFGRVGDIPGAEVSSRYWHYLRTGDARALDGVIDHNQWDVVSLAALVGLYGEPLALPAADDGATESGARDPSGLAPVDWAGLARTLRRAGSLELAHHVADRAVGRGGGAAALRTRGEIAKARGDKAQALADFESLVETIDDAKLRLELAKLYEHHAKRPLAALEMVRRGTHESEDAAAKRKRRLERKARDPRR